MSTRRKLYFRMRYVVILAVVAMISFAAAMVMGQPRGSELPRSTWRERFSDLFRLSPPPQHDHALFFTGSTPHDDAIYCGVKGTQQGVPYILYVSATPIGSGDSFQIIRKNGRPIQLTPPPVAGKTYSGSYSLKGILARDDVVKIMPVGGLQSMMASVAAGSAAEDYFNETPAQSDNFCITAPSEPGSGSAPMISPSLTASTETSAPQPMMTSQASITSHSNTPIYCGALRHFFLGRWCFPGLGCWERRYPYPYTLTVSATTASTSPGRFRITFGDRDSMTFEVPGNGTNTTTHALGGVPGVDDVVKITPEGDFQSLTASVEVWPGDYLQSPYDPFEETLDPLDPLNPTGPRAPAQSNKFCITGNDAGHTSAEDIFR